MELIMEATIHSLSPEGRGVTQFEGKTTFVEGALKDEKVTFEFIKRRSRFDEARVKDILEPSPDRVTPLCPHFGICGGCRLQHISANAQVLFKTESVKEQLLHFGKVIPKIWLPPIIGHSYQYRRKARLGVKYVFKKQKLLIGFREKQSSKITDIEYCYILEPKAADLIKPFAELLQALSCKIFIPQIEIAMGDSDMAWIIRHLEPISVTEITALITFAALHNFQLYLQPHGPESVHKIWPIDTEYRLKYVLPNLHAKFLFHPTDFTQINAVVNTQMITLALSLLAPSADETILDLFCGIGNFTIPLALHAKEVIGVEGSEKMVERLLENAAFNNLTNIQGFAANLDSPPQAAAWMSQPYDKILLDPPRSGALAILPFIAKSSVKRIVYISCNPATLARDVGELVHKYGFTLQSVGVMDMFTHTEHIESIALLER